MKGPAERCLTGGPSGAVLEMKGPAERCLTRRGPVQRCSSARRALFSGTCLHGGALFSGALLHGGPCSAVPVFTAGPCSAVLFCTAGPVQRYLSSRRGPVQRCSSARRALFSGTCLYGGALFSGALLHGGPCSAVPVFTAGPCSAVLFCTAGPVQWYLSSRRGPVQRCSSARRALFSGTCLHGGALFSGALLHGGPCSAVPVFTAGPCSAVLFCTAGPVQRYLSSRRGPLQRCSSARRALFSGALAVCQGSQTWPGHPAHSPSERAGSGPFGDGVLGPLVSSLAGGMGLVGPSCSALLVAVLSALLSFRSLDGALGPLPPLAVVAGEVARVTSLGAAVSVRSRRPFTFRVLLPGGGLAVPLLLTEVSLPPKGGLHMPCTTCTLEAGLVVAEVPLGLFPVGGGGSGEGKRSRLER
ncbi:hypothetical protein NDU88_009323 [Pleurodeles waltl]|uniref:Uncharacterized protein n=1 Tax=Pleurodeles waltl TaxID=8319 RepID=A0AAV7NZ89_PLEWA|nr:hypothetical protein NDU88_009323 [Pleurodeles waltl]